jgi:hypothetical protein
MHNNRMRAALLMYALMSLSACQHPSARDATPGQSELLQRWLSQAAPQIAEHPEQYRTQILLTEIRRDAKGQPTLQQHQYRVDAEYLFPASTVKLAIAALALEYLQMLSQYGVTADSVMHTEPLLPDDSLVNRDDSATAGVPTVRHYIKKILLVSDNDAYNRLYELMGQQYINARLAELGFTGAQILHRLERPLSAEDNRRTNAVAFYDTSGKLLYRQTARTAPAIAARPYTPVGSAHMKDGKLQDKPLDFSQKNRWTVVHMHRLMQLIMLPDTITGTGGLKLTAVDRQFIQQFMQMLPGESNDPKYDPKEYWPTYVKFFIYGSDKAARIDPSVHIFNKVGDAYGFLLDSAYVKDDCSGTEFMLTAAVYVNADGVLNDNQYEYDSLGLPFLKRLGELALAHARSKGPKPCDSDRPLSHKP